MYYAQFAWIFCPYNFYFLIFLIIIICFNSICVAVYSLLFTVFHNMCLIFPYDENLGCSQTLFHTPKYTTVTSSMGHFFLVYSVPDCSKPTAKYSTLPHLFKRTIIVYVQHISFWACYCVPLGYFPDLLAERFFKNKWFCSTL